MCQKWGMPIYTCLQKTHLCPNQAKTPYKGPRQKIPTLASESKHPKKSKFTIEPEKVDKAPEEKTNRII